MSDEESDAFSGMSESGSEDYAPRLKVWTKVSVHLYLAARLTTPPMFCESLQAVAKPKAKAAPTIKKAPLVKSNAENVPPKSSKPAAVKKAAPKKKPVQSDDYGSDASEPERPQSSSRKGTGKKTDRPVEEVYQKKTQLEHILLRPDTYIGSVEHHTAPMWVAEETGDEDDPFRMVYKQITYVPGLYKIFDEILVNAADNKIRDPKMTALKVDIDRSSNSISIFNNGRGIPIEMHPVEGVYVPELIFGHLLTSSNYDDSEKKVVGGRNGFGAKLCNIFSKEFVVETWDKSKGKKFKQVFRNNMSDKSEPVIGSQSSMEGTKITFKPDFAKFGMVGIDDDLMSLLQKRVLDMCATVRNVKVQLNGQSIRCKDFKSYCELYLRNRSSGNDNKIVYERVSDRWEIGFALSDGQFQQISFVNSISTYKGGTHVAYVADQVVKVVSETVSKKNKKGGQIKPHQIKQQLWLFVNCLVENPTFDSQTKENLTLKASAFGSKCALSEDFTKKVIKSGVVDAVLSFADFAANKQLKKTDGSKKARVSGITKLEDANNAGTRRASECTLILTEGDSAKALAMAGLSVVGRDNFGVFPLRGKLLNVREAGFKQIMENQEIQALKQILGLQQKMEYNSVEKLRYGKIMVMTDQDHDGSHIKGLIINMLDHFWPSLLQIPGFLQEFITPIVKVTKGKGRDRRQVSFFTLPEYESWREEHDGGKGWVAKYYKGLGTSTSQEAKEYFSAMAKHRKPFSPADPQSRELIDMAFGKKRADDRKDWLRQFQPGTFIDHSAREIRLPDFINKELILFSVVVDGLKPGHRKIIFASFKRNLKGEIKVAQLVGYVAEHSAYHHGEASLGGTIVGLAQDFVGSNNISLMEPIGQFGTRAQGGKDAASTRYIFTSLSPVTRKIFHPADDALLNYLVDDGQSIEPEWYMPIIPMVLVNGSDGIGTGWSTLIPNYNPAEIVENIRRRMRDEEMMPMSPWYRGYRGTIERSDVGKEKDKWKVTGVIRKISDTTVEITELPIKTWTQTYKEQLESWLQGSEKQPAWIKDYKEYHTDVDVRFEVTLSPEEMEKAEAEGLEKKFKLVGNMVCFDASGRIKKYESPMEIINDFYDLRLDFYGKRKGHLRDVLEREQDRLENKVRFLIEIIEGKLVVSNRKKAVLLEELRKRKYTPFPKATAKKPSPATPDEDPEEVEEDGDGATDSIVKGDHGYDYLLTMPIWNLTWEKVEQLRKELAGKQSELDELLRMSPKDLWERDLVEFMKLWEETELKFEKERKNAVAMKPSGKGGKGKAAPAKKIPKKKAMSDSDDGSDGIMDSDDDDEDDFVPEKGEADTTLQNSRPYVFDLYPQVEKNAPKPKLAAAPASKTVVKKEPVVKQELEQPSIVAAFAKQTSKAPPKATKMEVDSEASSDEDSFEARLKKRMDATGAGKPQSFSFANGANAVKLESLSDSEKISKPARPPVTKKIPPKISKALPPKPVSSSPRKKESEWDVTDSEAEESDFGGSPHKRKKPAVGKPPTKALPKAPPLKSVAAASGITKATAQKPTKKRRVDSDEGSDSDGVIVASTSAAGLGGVRAGRERKAVNYRYQKDSDVESDEAEEEDSALMPSKNILLLGSGFVAGPCAEYLLRSPDNTVTIASRKIEHAKKLAGSHARAVPIALDVNSVSALESEIAKHDLVISLIPYTYHATVIKAAIKHKKHVVTTSYVSPAMEELHEAAVAAGITVFNEIGVDPGVDHLYALKTIDEVHAAGGKILGFTSWCGGLPAPEDSNNPLGYKFSWSSRGVLLALRNSAKFLQGGEVVEIQGEDLMLSAKPIFTGYPGFAFEGYANRDSTPYAKRYGIPEAKTVIRGTLRYSGFPRFVKALVDCGLLQDDKREYLSATSQPLAWRDFMARLLGCPNDDESLEKALSRKCKLEGAEQERVLHGFKWLGLFSDTPVKLQGNPLDTLCAVLEEKMEYGDGERDLVFLQHRFDCELKDGGKETRYSTGVWFGKPNGTTAMALTVGLPCGVATQMILDGKISKKGVLAPMTKDLWEPLLLTLKKEGIEMVETVL
ncbi:DNA topoisomerase 2 [Gonapodya sp. JEL0774]|nr:DNA topoisomerase 2 [Gonapodya sp. JEL0774]